MNLLHTVSLLLVAGGLAAQTTVPFPAEYVGITEGPQNSPNLPLANGTSRNLIVYDRADMAVPVGASITHLGFRQDATTTGIDTGRTLQLEVRMGWTTNDALTPSTTFDANYDGAPVTVFGPALFQLPNLRDAANPLPNGQLSLPLTTPFTYAPAGRNLVVEYRVLGNSGGGTSFNYRLDRADFYSPVFEGPAGCPHSGSGTPTLSVSPVRIGASLTVNGATGPANSFGIVVLNVGGRLVAPYSLAGIFPGIAATCRGQIDVGQLATIGTGTGTTGGFTLFYSIPNAPVLNDVWLSHQAVLLDVFAPGGVVTSNGAEVQIGIRPRTTIVAAQGPPATTTTGSLNTNYCPVAFFRYQ